MLTPVIGSEIENQKPEKNKIYKHYFTLFQIINDSIILHRLLDLNS